MQAMRERLYGELLDPSQVDALDVVVAEGACRMRRLAEVLRIDASTATRTVDRLERAGLVARGAADGDGRAVLVRPTAAGRALHARLNARRRAMLLEVLSGFDAAEREQLAGLLERLVAGVDRYARG
jgi:DNA-binding MarR family transcriptional regulator